MKSISLQLEEKMKIISLHSHFASLHLKPLPMKPK